MSDAAPAASSAPSGSGFSPRVILALVGVAILAFAGLTVLVAYAPDMRGRDDVRGHALSSSAVGFRGAIIMLEAQGITATANRVRPRTFADDDPLLVLTPQLETTGKEMKAFAKGSRVLIVLPKWVTSPDPNPLRRGFVTKAGAGETTKDATELLADFAPATVIARRRGVTRPQLRGGGTLFPVERRYQLGPIDQLQTLSGDGWLPALVDEHGAVVLGASRAQPGVMVLADPDLLNNQGLASLDNARMGMDIVGAMRGDNGVRFDVTLAGYSRGRGLLRLMLEPPWLAATLCAVAVALLMGAHSLTRFGPTSRRGRALALGVEALVDNSAGLVRMARREAEFARPYAALTFARVVRVARGRSAAETDTALAAEMARLRGADAPEILETAAAAVRTRDDLLAVGRRLYQWRQEVTSGRR